MQRRLRITMVAAAAAGAVAVGTGTAYAEGIFKAPSDNSCTRSVDKDKPEKETDFPSFHDYEAESNANSKDLRDGHGNLYAAHNSYCDGPRPWRGWDWHDKSYDTFGFKRAPGQEAPSWDPHKNQYEDLNGYNKSFQKDPHRYTKLEPDHIGAPKHPQYQPH